MFLDDNHQSKWIPLYYRTSNENAVSIAEDAFGNEFAAMDLAGVWLSNRPLGSADENEDCLLRISVFMSVHDIFYYHEVLEVGKEHRDFVFPTEILNDPAHCKVEVLTPEQANLVSDPATCARFDEYPPGEPETAFALLQEHDA